VSKAELESISIPNSVDTPIGELKFFDGVPSDTTIDKLYDNLDRMRGVEVFLDNVGAVSMNSVRKGLAGAGAEGANKIAVFEQLMDSQTLVVTANTSTLYAYTYTDLTGDGPTVIEVPPRMLGFLNDGWQRFVGNMGVTGPDKGKGGKYLVLPPGYTGDVPDGYFLMKPPTNRNFLHLRVLVCDRGAAVVLLDARQTQRVGARGRVVIDVDIGVVPNREARDRVELDTLELRTTTKDGSARDQVVACEPARFGEPEPRVHERPEAGQPESLGLVAGDRGDAQLAQLGPRALILLGVLLREVAEVELEHEHDLRAGIDAIELGEHV
jgi:hypothetical protein